MKLIYVVIIFLVKIETNVETGRYTNLKINDKRHLINGLKLGWSNWPLHISTAEL